LLHCAKKAEQIHTVSEFSKQAMVDIYHIPESIIHIVPDGVDLSLFNKNNCESASIRVRNIFRVENYILSVGRIEPRKNHIGLLYAYSEVKQQQKDIGPLVIVGQKDFKYKKFFELISRLKLNDSVKVFEGVTDEMLPDIYKAARLFVYPSFAEGFGVPPLEAMACGVPVVTSNTTAIPEVVGNAALLIDPNKPHEIAEAIFKLISNRKMANDFVTKGIEQAERFSWHNASLSYLEAIKNMDKN